MYTLMNSFLFNSSTRHTVSYYWLSQKYFSADAKRDKTFSEPVMCCLSNRCVTRS